MPKVRRRRYWRRSSRWRAAVKRSNPSQLGYWRLQILAENCNPLNGDARMRRIWHCESIHLSEKLQAMLSEPSPWLQLIDAGAVGDAHRSYQRTLDAIYRRREPRERHRRNNRRFPTGMGDVISVLINQA